MSTQFFLSLATGIFIGGAAGYLGALMLQKRMALVAGPLGHLALPGVALALLYGFNISLGAFPFVILGIFLIWLLELKTNIPAEALTAIVFASGVAIAFLFLPIEQAEAALVGNIAILSWQEALVAIILSFLIIVITKIIFSKMMLINVSEDLARVEGINVRRYNLIYLILIAIIVSLGVKLVGALLTAALVAIPAATAKNLAKSNKLYVVASLLAGSLSAVVGLIIFKLTGYSAGISIILSSAVLFLISLLFQKKYD